MLYRSALKVSMSENMQTKPGELVPSSNLEPSNAMDEMFAGLGLGSYVSKKDTGAIATGLMSNTKSQVYYQILRVNISLLNWRKI